MVLAKMATEDCVNGNMKDSNYSLPVPIIGLYTAGATWVCLLFMIFDIISAFRKRQRWIPCRLFSLNSVTLALLSVLTKLQVDLTTHMPSLQDQLSKLTGSTLLCISMGFLSPSIGEGTTSESLTNMTALTILVITIIVNICIQLSTGVILLFVPEHIIIICFMLMILLLLWHSALDWSSVKKCLHDHNKKLITQESGSLLERLKLCHIYGFSSNSQLNLSGDLPNIVLSGFGLVCMGILAQAIFRSLILRWFKFCEGVSDYKWSMWIIVISQILTVFVGGFASSFRGTTLLTRSIIENRQTEVEELYHLIRENHMLGGDSGLSFLITVVQLIGLTIMALFFISLLPLYVFWLLCINMRPLFGLGEISFQKYCIRIESLKGYEHLIGRQGAVELNAWTVWKAATDMNSWMEASTMKTPLYLSQLFSRTSPSPELQTMELKGLLYPNEQNGIEVSPLSMALLAKLAAFSIPSDRTEALQHAFSEVSEIVDFVYTRINDATRESRLESKLAKAVMLGNGFNCFYPTRRSLHGDEIRLDHALQSIGDIMNEMPKDFVLQKVHAIANLIYCGQYVTIDDLHNYLEQIFVDMLHLFLAQFPNVVYMYINESPAEKFEERVRFALKLIWKIQHSEAQVQWSFPVGSNIWSLITPQATQSATSPHEVVNVDNSLDATDIHSTVPPSHNDVTIPIE